MKFVGLLVCVLTLTVVGCDQNPIPPRPGAGAGPGTGTGTPDKGATKTPTKAPAPPKNNGGKTTKTPTGKAAPLGKLPAPSPDAHLTSDSAWDRYATAQKQWRKDLANLMTKDRPDLKPVVDLNLKLQIAKIDLQAARFRYLKKNDSSRINRSQGIGEFVNFDWSDADQAKMIANSRTALVEATRVQRLEKEVKEHPLWKERSSHFRKKVSLSPEYEDALNRFESARDEAGRSVGG